MCTKSRERAIWNKSGIIEAQGGGLSNWVIVLAQGFPIDAGWYEQMTGPWPENVDGICVVATEGYVGAYSNLVPYNDLTALLLKCPSDSSGHNCYHPGYTNRVSGMDTDFKPLSMDDHSIEEVSSAAWDFPLPTSPIKKTLTIRDQDERELSVFWGALLTPSQVKEVLDATGYKWRELAPGSLLLCAEDDVSNPKECRAEIRYLGDSTWTGSVFYKGNQRREDFVEVETAEEWCELQVAMLQLHVEG